ncbi:hypothetical protein OOU_Y34scaffold00500g10 [Pyricularia oryzae Y34]|uniref:Uncharacterized protein n=2 Tax=Pyricularia oryzae TaxID=318829 RepID=A0AA97NZV7_PYRO3|nr:hypothetical protein OOU_Y34scaffold00500g10 [Pyricularia oryzae Y34]
MGVNGGISMKIKDCKSLKAKPKSELPRTHRLTATRLGALKRL